MRSKKLWSVIFATLGMTMLILDSATALSGATEGIALCMRTVIPSLFPFFVFSILLTGQLNGRKIPFLRYIGSICCIPEGGESLLAIGLLGGYPVGAGCIANAWRIGQLEKEDAQRLLGFCSNAGPAFIFGMVGSMFSSPLSGWLLWVIHVLSAIMVGAILPGKRHTVMKPEKAASITLVEALERSVKVMASVCAWIVWFRVIISFCDRWFLWLLPQPAHVLFTGILELANGCCSLQLISAEPVRFLICSGLLALGGLCVGMQTLSVTHGLGTGAYFPGKLLQCCISICLSAFTLPFLFHEQFHGAQAIVMGVISAIFLCLIFVMAPKMKKTVAFPKALLYNGRR